jgi:hypothetical protein
MPDNQVLFQIGGDWWTLAAVCLALGLALLAIGAGLLTLLLARHGRTTRLHGHEASRVAFNAGNLGMSSARFTAPPRALKCV